jgi:hypothetical protein
MGCRSPPFLVGHSASASRPVGGLGPAADDTDGQGSTDYAFSSLLLLKRLKSLICSPASCKP